MASSIRIEEQRQKRDSLTMSIIIHGLLLLILLIPIISAIQKEPEPPKFQGIQVAFGAVEAERRTETKAAPAAANAKPQKVSKAKPQPKKAAPPKSTNKPSAKPTPVKIISKTVKKEAPVTAVAEPQKKSKEALQAEEAQRKADAKAKAKAEAEEKARLEAEEAEQKKREEAERKAAEKAAKKAAAKSKFNNMMNSADGTGEPSKGDPKGRPNAAALEGMTKGKGKAGNGLGDRGLLHAPDITDSSQRTGIVVVNICVNSQGKVTKANYTQKGSTTTDSHLIRLATESAKEYRFSQSKTAEQCGDITINFKLR